MEAQAQLNTDKAGECAVKYLTPLIEIQIDRLIPDPRNSQLFPLDDLDSIVESIQTLGIIEPIIIQPVASFDDILKYQDANAEEVVRSFARFCIKAGHRRVEAAKRLGMKKVPARVIIPLIEGVDVLLLVHENLTQRQLSPSAVTKALDVLRDNCPIELVLARLPEEIRKAYLEGVITESFIRALMHQPSEKIKRVIQDIGKLAILGVKDLSSAEEFERLREEIERKDKLLSKLLEEKARLEEEKKTLELEKEALQGAIERLEFQVRQANLEKENIQSSIERLQQELEQIPVSNTEEIEEKELQIRELKSALNLKKQEITELKRKLEQERKKYELAKAEMENIVKGEVNRRIEEIKKEFQVTVSEIKNQVESEKNKLEEEKQRLQRELEQIRKKHAREIEQLKKLKPSEHLSPAVRQTLAFIQATKETADLALEIEEICETLHREGQRELILEAVVAMEELAKGLIGIADSIRKTYKIKK